MHERQQRKGFGNGADGMSHQLLCQPYRLVAQLAPNDAISVGREIPFSEKHVQHRSHSRQPRGELGLGQTAELEVVFSKPTLRPREPLVRIGFADEESLGDFPDVEAAQDLQREHELRFERYRFFAASKQQTQRVVPNVASKKCLHLIHRRRLALRALLRGEIGMARTTAQLPQEVVLRDAEEPRRRVFRSARPRPTFDSRRQRELHGVFDQVEMPRAHAPRQDGDQAAVLVTEKVLSERRHHPGARISITSTPEPGSTGPGHSPAISLNFSYIACICAGEGFSALASPPGRLRCKHKYLGMVLQMGWVDSGSTTP